MRLALLLVPVSVWATTTVSVPKTNSVQILYEYTTTYNGNCTWAVSKSPSFTPVVNDVDPVQFPTSNNDGQTTVGARQFVVGHQYNATNNVSVVVSRGLQALTVYYGQVTCGADVVSAPPAVSRNIPTGLTHNAVPQVDPSTPGGWLLPTVSGVRGQPIVDSHTGALRQAISIAADKVGGSDGIYPGDGGFSRPCADNLQTPGDGTTGYICIFWQYQDSRSAIYYIPTNAPPRCLGGFYSGNPVQCPQCVIDNNLNIYYYDAGGGSGAGYYRAQYTGGFTAVANALTTASTGPPQLYAGPGVGAFLQAYFNPSFNPSSFNCGYVRPILNINHEKQGFACFPPGPTQDVPAWLGVADMGDGRPWDITQSAYPYPTVIAAWNLAGVPSNCLLHNWQTMPQSNNLIFANVKSNAGDCSIGGFASVVWWEYLTDPNGTSVFVDPYFPYGGHLDTGTGCDVTSGNPASCTVNGFGGKVTEGNNGWQFLPGWPLINFLNIPLLDQTDSPLFAGQLGFGFGSATSKHPSYQQVAAQTNLTQQLFYNDLTPWDGVSGGTATLVGGTSNTYLYVPFQPLQRKQLATIAHNADHSLRDVSGPGCVINDSTTWQYGVVYVAGECRAGSMVGQVYASIPSLANLACLGGDGPIPTNNDICVENASAYANAIPQMIMGGNSPLWNTSMNRVISTAFSPMMDYFYFSTAKLTPNGQFALIPMGVGSGGSSPDVNMWMVTLPPYTSDTLGRDNFRQVPIKVTSVPTGTNNVIVYIGYDEDGGFCTSRIDTCIGGTTVSPFAYAADGAGGVITGLTGTACTAGCTVNVSAIPNRILKYQIVYRNGSNVILQTDSAKYVVVP